MIKDETGTAWSLKSEIKVTINKLIIIIYLIGIWIFFNIAMSFIAILQGTIFSCKI